MDEIYTQIVQKIIEKQEAIIGPVAVQQAQMVSNLEIDWAQHEISISGSPLTAVDDLVEQYKDLFGQIAVETCKEAVSKILIQLPVEQQPQSLQ